MIRLVSSSRYAAASHGLLRGFVDASSTSTGRKLISTDTTTPPSGRLAGKVAIITGASSGIGRATAAEFVRNGAAFVYLADVQHDLGRAVAAELGGDSVAAFVPCDVTSEADISAAVDLAVSQHGRLDIMYNNAGIGGRTGPGAGGFASGGLDLAEFDRVMAANARSAVAGIKHAARVMVPRGSGSILCTSSVCGIVAGLATAAYSVSKAAVAAAAKSVAAELCGHGVRVNCISPHAIPTPLLLEGMRGIFPAGASDEQLAMVARGFGELAGASCEVEDVARAAVFLASDEAKYISGHNLVVDGGFTVYKKLPFSTTPLPRPIDGDRCNNPIFTL